MRVPIANSFYESRSSNFDSQRLINMYPEYTETGTSETQFALYGTPGLRLFSTLTGSGGNRGLHVTAKGGRTFTVIGNTLYEIYSDGAYVSRGTLNSSSGRVSISDNLLQLIIVDGK